MRIIVYADASGHDLQELLVAAGHEVRLLAPGAVAARAQADVCLVMNLAAGALPSYQSWLAQLPAPTMLVTTALAAGHALCPRVAQLRLICHPSRALPALTELLEMTREVRAGALVLGPLGQRPAGWGARGAAAL